MRRVFLCDPSLKDGLGHHYMLTENIAQHCEAAGLKTIWLVHQKFSVTVTQHSMRVLYRCFSEGTYDVIKKRHGLSHTATNHETPAERGPTKLSEVPAGSTRTKLKQLALRAYRQLPYGIREVLSPVLRRLLRLPPSGQVTVSAEATKPARRAPDGELAEALKRFQAREEDLVLFHSSDARDYQAIHAFFEQQLPISRWEHQPTFHLSTPYDEVIMPHNHFHPPMQVSVKRMMALGLLGWKVMLHAENELLAKHLSKLLDAEVSALPVPMSDDSFVPMAKQEHERLLLVYLGAARTEKGFNDLPGLVDAINASELANKVSLVLQVTPQIVGYSPDIKASVERLRAMNAPFVTLVEEPHSPAAYKALLERADAVFLNYQADRYTHRGSGIAVEAIASASTVIATAGTFPEFVAGDACISINGERDFFSAVEELVRNRRRYREAAKERRSWYLTQHSGANFVAVLDDNSSLGDNPPVHQVEARSTPADDRTHWRQLVCSNRPKNLPDNRESRFQPDEEQQRAML